MTVTEVLAVPAPPSTATPTPLRLKLLSSHPIPADGPKDIDLSNKVSTEVVADGDEAGDGGSYEEGVEDAMLMKRLMDFVRSGNAIEVAKFPPRFFLISDSDEKGPSILHEAADVANGSELIKAVLSKIKLGVDNDEGKFKEALGGGDITPVITAIVSGNVDSAKVLLEEGAEVDLAELEQFEVEVATLEALGLNKSPA